MSSGRRAARIVAVGDLNGALDGLVDVLRGTGIINRQGRWSGGDTHLIQMGDVFNRGDSARGIFEFLERLRMQAGHVGGQVSMLLGNHEAMMVLGNESYCTVGEYLAFATAAERAAWPRRVNRAYLRIFRDQPLTGPIPPFRPRLDAWMAASVPGRETMRRALSPGGRLGKMIRRLPVILQVDDLVFVHAGLTPAWARLGVDGINRTVRTAWESGPSQWGEVSKRSILRAPNSPIMTRRIARGEGGEVEGELTRVLASLGARRMVIGHTMTSYAPGGRPGRVLTRFRNRLVYTDVGIRQGDDGPRAALIVDQGVGYEWRPDGTSELWRD